ncbi:MAG: DUF551 domain-containing protein [Pseudomonadales bacterium]|nr:DUF551 domain-containing protein [Pseudomonadales bacterium]
MKHDDALPALPIGEAEVLWHEPDPVMPERPGKIIDASHAFMDAAPLGTRLYSAEQMRAYARAVEARVREKMGEGWIACSERMPEAGVEVLVWLAAPVVKGGSQVAMDTWDEQHEAPVSWSSATIPVGVGWDSGTDWEGITHWMPLPAAPGAAPPPAAPQPEFARGIDAAARLVEQRLADYDAEHGSTDSDTGAREYPGTGDEYVCELAEIAEAIRGLAPPPAAPCPHIRSSGVGDHATHWCVLNGPPSAGPSADVLLLRETFALCEATEDECGDADDAFRRGRAFEAKRIRRGIGTWYQDTLCGRSHMGEPVPAAPPAAPEPSANERRLRRLLCIARHGRSAYTDDGEASDCSGHPSIDYLRDSLDEIEAKWRLRASATLTAPEPSEAEVAAAMASLHRAMEPAAWPSEDEITDALRAAAAARGE